MSNPTATHPCCASRSHHAPAHHAPADHARHHGTVRPATAAAAEYVCPMHPEIVQATPGDCPICGMALEPRVASLDDAPSAEQRSMTSRLWFAAALTVPLVAIAMSAMWPGQPLGRVADALTWARVQGLLAAPVVLWAGWPFFVRGAASIRQRSPNMFTLIAIGTGAAFGYSALTVIAPGAIPHALRHGGAPPVYFEAAAVIVTLVLLGQVLELRARHAAACAIRALLGLQPRTARVVTDDGEADVAIDAVVVGDRVRVRPGERIAVDGVVVDGRSTVDESMINPMLAGGAMALSSVSVMGDALRLRHVHL